MRPSATRASRMARTSTSARSSTETSVPPGGYSMSARQTSSRRPRSIGLPLRLAVATEPLLLRVPPDANTPSTGYAAAMDRQTHLRCNSKTRRRSAAPGKCRQAFDPSPSRRHLIPSRIDRGSPLSSPAMRALHVRRLALVEYEDGLRAQRLLVAARAAGTIPHTLLLLAHPRVAP